MQGERKTLLDNTLLFLGKNSSVIQRTQILHTETSLLHFPFHD